MNTLPDFNYNHVLPPHKGNPTLPSDVSPYRCSIMDLCLKFATSQRRIKLLKGLTAFRIKMINEGIVDGFQWIDGSFIENIEVSGGRDPKDIDIVTFYKDLDPSIELSIPKTFPDFVNSRMSKTNYNLDHYVVNYGVNPEITVEATRYWIQLFSHTRLGVWKGIIQLPLSNTTTEDDYALQYLNGL